MKRIDFKVLPTLLDYIMLLEGAPSISKPYYGDVGVNKQKRGVRGRDYWYVYLNWDIIARSGFSYKFSETEYSIIKSGVWMKTPFKRLSTGLASFDTDQPQGFSTEDLLGNSILYLFFLIYLHQYRNPKNGLEFLYEFLRIYANLIPYPFMSSNPYLTITHPAYTFVKNIFKISYGTSDWNDIPLNRLGLINGSIFCLFPPQNSIQNEKLGVVQKSGDVSKYITIQWYDNNQKLIIDRLNILFGVFPSTDYMPTIENLALQSNLKNLSRGTNDSAVPDPKLFAFSTYTQGLMLEHEIKNNLTPFFYISGKTFSNVSPYYVVLTESPIGRITLNLHYPYDGNDFPYNTTLDLTPWEIIWKIDESIAANQEQYGFFIQTESGIHYGKLVGRPDFGGTHSTPPVLYSLSDKTKPSVSLRIANEIQYKEFITEYINRVYEIFVDYAKSYTTDPYANGVGIIPWTLPNSSLAQQVSLSHILYNLLDFKNTASAREFPITIPLENFPAVNQTIKQALFVQGLIDPPNESLIHTLLSLASDTNPMFTIEKSNSTVQTSSLQTRYKVVSQLKIDASTFYNYFKQAHIILDTES